MDESYRRIDDATVRRYSERWKQHGQSPLTLGWGSEAQQAYRFDRVLESVDCGGRSVLDVGCGFADLYAHMKARGVSARQYLGVDLNPELLAAAARQHPDAVLRRASLMDLTARDISADVGVMLGLLNFRQQDVSNVTYLESMVSRAYGLCREALVFDALSACRVPDYPEESAVYYYDVGEVLRIAMKLTPHVALRHDYSAIPQREMLVVLRRTPWP